MSGTEKKQVGRHPDDRRDYTSKTEELHDRDGGERRDLSFCLGRICVRVVKPYSIGPRVRL